MPTGSVASTNTVSATSMREATPVRTTGMVLALEGLWTAYDTGAPATRWLSESVMKGVTWMVAPRTVSGITSVSSSATESRSGAVKVTESRWR